MTTATGIVDALTGGNQESPELPLGPSIDVPKSLVAQIANKVVRDFMDARAHGKPIFDYSIQTHGIMYSDYFQGVSTVHTRWDEVYTGVGENAYEALDDALDNAAVDDWDVRSVKNEYDPNDPDNVQNSIRANNPEMEDDDEGADGVYYYVSIFVRGIPKDGVDESKEDLLKMLGRVAIDAGKKWLKPGESITHGTHIIEDILFSYLGTLEQLDKPKANHIKQEYADEISAALRLIRNQEQEGDREIVDDFTIQTMEQVMGQYCPPFTYFGSSPGDGSAIGCWPDYDRLNEVELGEDEDAIFLGYATDAAAAVRSGKSGIRDKKYAVWHPESNPDGWEVWDIRRGKMLWSY